MTMRDIVGMGNAERQKQRGGLSVSPGLVTWQISNDVSVIVSHKSVSSSEETR